MIAIILGTRAELIKIFPIMRELQRRKIGYTFIHTGQHNLGHLTKILGVKSPDIILTTPPKTTTKFWVKRYKAIKWCFFVIPRIWWSLSRIKNLKWVLYHGDTMSTVSAAIAASKLLNPFKKYKNVHLEAGLRSGSLREPFPEEISRRLADKLSDVLFAVSKETEKNLQKEIIFGRIINVGNTIVDSTVLACNIARKFYIKKPQHGDYILVTIHRDENIRHKKRLENLVNILLNLPIKTYFPMHDNTKKQLIKFGLYDKLQKAKHIKIIRLLNYVEFIYWLKHCKLLLTDGGSVQEESLVFKKPCFLFRKKTERTEGLKTGINFLIRLDLNLIKKYMGGVLSSDYVLPEFKNPYGEFGVSKRIVNYLVGE